MIAICQLQRQAAGRLCEEWSRARLNWKKKKKEEEKKKEKGSLVQARVFEDYRAACLEKM